MNTDYKNLDAFEASIIVVAAIGVVLIGNIMFYGLPESQTHSVASAVSILDMHEQVAAVLQQADLAVSGFLNYSDQVAVDYGKGSVAGAAIELPNLGFNLEALPRPDTDPPETLHFPYSYSPPDATKLLTQIYETTKN